jgi:hypothetical protein
MMPGRHSHRGRHAPVARRAREAVLDGTDVARGLQAKTRSWLIMWSKWRQKYTGFACFTREPLIVDEADFNRFQIRIMQTEQAYDRPPIGSRMT